MANSKPGLFGRLRRAISSQLNAVVDDLSDPGQEVGLLIDDLAAQIKVAQGNLRQALVDQKVMEKKLGEIESTEAGWQSKAEQALKIGDESLARAALEQKSAAQQKRLSVMEALNDQRQTVASMKSEIERSTARHKELSLRRGTLMAQARANKQAEEGGGVADSGSGLADIEAKIDAMEAMQEAHAELSAEKEEAAKVQRQFDEMESKTEIDDELAALKQKLAGQKSLTEG